MQFKDYYETLGLKRNAVADDIKKAYRKMARKYHPDVSKEKNAEARFKEVQEAYEVLKDPDKRASYDQLGRDYRPGQQFRTPPGWEQRYSHGGGAGGSQRFSDLNGFSDFFSTLFGGATGGSMGGGGGSMGGGPPPDNDGGTLEITLEEAYAGTKRRVITNDGGHARTVDVQVPAGINDGQALRVGGNQRSALLFRVKLLPHALYTVQGRDVLIELPLAPWEAALGAKVAVPTLGGKVELTVPAGAQTGQRLRLRGRGLPGGGDQLVSIKIMTPTADTAEAKEAYERMKREFQFDPRADWP
jgi:curved DNA-binding protein